MPASADGWRFFLDAGGTFTDCIAISPEHAPKRAKVLSSGCIRSAVSGRDGARVIRARLPENLPDGFFMGWSLQCGDQRVQIANSAGQQLTLAQACDIF